MVSCERLTTIREGAFHHIFSRGGGAQHIFEYEFEFIKKRKQSDLMFCKTEGSKRSTKNNENSGQLDQISRNKIGKTCSKQSSDRLWWKNRPNLS